MKHIGACLAIQALLGSMGPRMSVERKVLLHTNTEVKRRNQKFPSILRGFFTKGLQV